MSNWGQSNFPSVILTKKLLISTDSWKHKVCTFAFYVWFRFFYLLRLALYHMLWYVNLWISLGGTTCTNYLEMMMIDVKRNNTSTDYMWLSNELKYLREIDKDT